MIRCPKCSTNNRPGAKFCAKCGNPFPQTVQAQQPQGQVQPQTNQPSKAGKIGFARLKNLGAKFATGMQKIAGGAIDRFVNPKPQLEGTVTNVRSASDEPPDFSWAKLIWAFVCFLFLLPVLPILLVFVLMVFLIQTIARINLLQVFTSTFLQLVAALKLTKDKKEPVQNFRVRDKSGQERDVRMKGYLRAGNISPGDVLTIWGKRKQGTLHFKKAENHQTSSSVLLKNRVGKLQRTVVALGLFYLLSLVIVYLIQR